MNDFCDEQKDNGVLPCICLLYTSYMNAPNLIWIIGGDRSGDGKNFAIWNALATGIKSVDKNHLMTYHPHGEHSSSFWFHNASWLDFNMCQSGHAQQDFAIYQRLLVWFLF